MSGRLPVRAHKIWQALAFWSWMMLRRTTVFPTMSPTDSPNMFPTYLLTHLLSGIVSFHVPSYPVNY